MVRKGQVTVQIKQRLDKGGDTWERLGAGEGMRHVDTWGESVQAAGSTLQRS